MNILLINIKWLFLILFTINLAIIFAVKSDKRFLISILFWAILIASFFVLKDINGRRTKKQEKEYYSSMGDKSYGDFKLWQNSEAQKFQARQTNMTLFRLLGAQTILTFIIQIIAYRKAKKQNTFWWTRTSFGVLTFVYLIFELFVSIIPTKSLI